MKSSSILFAALHLCDKIAQNPTPQQEEWSTFRYRSRSNFRALTDNEAGAKGAAINFYEVQIHHENLPRGKAYPHTSVLPEIPTAAIKNLSNGFLPKTAGNLLRPS